MTWRLVQAFGVVLALAVGAAPASGQTERGSIVGTVRDAQGGVLPGATVTVRNEQTGVAQTFVTNERGTYDAPFLPPGTYAVEVTLSGFQTASVTGIEVNVGARVRRDVTLRLPGVEETVTVRAESALVQTQSASIGQVIDEVRLATLPNFDRNIYNFLTLTSTVTAPPGGNAPAFRLESGGSFAVSGSRPSSVTFKIDGLANTDPTFGTPTITPSMDSVQEFQIQNSSYSAEFEGIGQVNVATKAGTSTFRGSAFDYLRNEALQPTHPVLRRKPRQRYNQFGGTLGGPVPLGDTFFFVSYEGRRQDAQSVGTIRVLTAAERGGDFSAHLGGCQTVGGTAVPRLLPSGQPSGECIRVGQIFDPATTLANPAFNPGQPVSALNPQYIRQPFAGNQIPASRLSSVARALVEAQQPLPNRDDPTANYLGVAGPRIDLDQFSVRLDHAPTEQDRVYGRLAIQNNRRINASLLPYQTKNLTGEGDVFSASWSRILGPSMVNELRVGYVHGLYGDSIDEIDASQFGIANTFLPTLPRLFVRPGNLNYGGFSASILQTEQKTFQLANNFSWVRGQHSIKAGVAIDHNRFTSGEFGNNTAGTATFGGLYTAGNNGLAATQTQALADMMLGLAESGTLNSPSLSIVRNTPWSVYVQDDWRVAERVTLNLGLRYEYHQPWRSMNGGGSRVDLGGEGRLLVVDPRVAEAANSPFVVCCADERAVEADRNDFAPRIGVAWQPFRADSLTVRAGYGLFYSDQTQFFEWQQYQPFFRPSFNAAQGDFLAPGATLDNLFPRERFTEQGGIIPSFPSGVPPSVIGHQVISFSSLGPNSTPYMHQWSVSLQRELLPRLLGEVSYTGSLGRNLPIQWIFNQPTPSPTPVNFASPDPAANPYLRRPYACCSITSFAVANVLESEYNAVTVKLDKRFSQGYQFLTSYTWSRSLDHGSEVFALANTFNILSNNRDFDVDWGRSSFDVPHRWVTSGTLELPFGQGRRWLDRGGVVNALVGGWRVAGVFTIQSGFPFTPNIRNLRSNTGYALATERGDLVGNPYWSSSEWDRLVAEWKAGNDRLFLINPEAIGLDYPMGTFGNIPRNFFRTPFGYQLDLSAAKSTALPGRARFEFRADVLNATSERLNRLNLVVAGLRATNFLTHPTVGSVNPYALMFNPRIIQLSARITF